MINAHQKPRRAKTIESELNTKRKARNEIIARGDVTIVYHRSDAALTKQLHATLEKQGKYGILAALLLKAQKASDRAKDYRGETKGLAYDRKAQSLYELCQQLSTLDYPWGWGTDPGAYCEWVLYCDLPTGQVSWHAHDRGEGPDYPGQWDGQEKASTRRILKYATQVLNNEYPGPG